MSWVDAGLFAANDFCQGLVDMIPGGRTIVNGAHGAENWAYGEQVDYNALTDKGSKMYMAGEVSGVAWNVGTGVACSRLLVAAAPKMAASSIPFIKYIGVTIPTVRALKGIDAARKCMEITRATMFLMKLWFNQQRLNSGRINRQQFDKMLDNDRLNYAMGATIWALPGTGGLWIAAGNMALGTILNQLNMETAMGKGK